MNFRKFFYSFVRILAAVIMIQTLYFKFTGSPESVYIFTTVGMEPWGRWSVGVMELIASLLLLMPSSAWLGGGLALGLMAGAIGMHLTLLGVSVQGDGGYLFFLAVVVTICSLAVLWMDQDKVRQFVTGFNRKE